MPRKKNKRKIERANDREPNVRIEIQAARLEPAGATLGGWCYEGYFAHPHGLDLGLASDRQAWRLDWEAGWLTRELRSHDDRESRDADAWPWDPARPLAGQYEWLSHRQTSPDGSTVTEQTRHDVAASVARHAELDAIEYETTRAAEPDCRDDDDADQRIIEALVRIGEDRAPGPLTADQVIAAAHAEDAAYAEAALEDGVSEAMVELATERVPS